MVALEMGITPKMQDQIDALDVRVSKLEGVQVADANQVSAIKSDTEELLQLFKALKGAWVVLNAVGKLAKPLTAIVVFLGSIYYFKDGIPK